MIKTTGFRFLKKKMIIIPFPFMEIVWLPIFEGKKVILGLAVFGANSILFWICPKIFWFFFSTANRFLYASKHFPKFFFMQNFVFFCHNVVLDTIILELFSFSFYNFFQKRWKFLFLPYGVFMYALINVKLFLNTRRWKISPNLKSLLFLLYHLWTTARRQFRSFICIVNAWSSKLKWFG